MPDFRTVDGARAWSDAPSRSTTERVKTGEKNRPEAEIKLKGRKVEIRTGSRVKRARGAWTSFKRGLTKFRSATWTLAKGERKARNLRHGEYRFDRHVNRLVEDLANGKKMDIKDVARRLEAIHKEGERIKANDPGVDDDKLAQRFRKNLNESLHALGRVNPDALVQVMNAFKPGGPMHNLRVNYTMYNDPAMAALVEEDLNDDRGLDPMDYIDGDIADRPPATILNAMNDLAAIPQNMPALAQGAAAEQLTKIVKEQIPQPEFHDIVDDLNPNELTLLRDRDKAYIAAHLKSHVDQCEVDKDDLNRDHIKHELRVAIGAVKIGLPAKLEETNKLPTNNANPPFPENLGLSLSSGLRDSDNLFNGIHRHLEAVGGFKSFANEDHQDYSETNVSHCLRRLQNGDPSRPDEYEDRLTEALDAVNKTLWRQPNHRAAKSLTRLQAELTVALTRYRLHSLGNPAGVAIKRGADDNYDSPLYDCNAVRNLVNRDRIGSRNQYSNPFKGMPVSDFWKMFVDREYQAKTQGSGARYHEGVFDRGDRPEPGFMRGMVEAMETEVCGKLGQKITPDDIERLHDVGVRHISDDYMLRGYRDKLIAKYGVAKYSKGGMKKLEQRLASHTGGSLAWSERNELRGLSVKQKFEKLKAMNQAEKTDNPPDGMQTWGFINKDTADPTAYFWPKDRAQSRETTQKVLNTYYKEIGKASTEQEKMRAIVKCCQTLHQLHVFRDGNARTMGMLLLNRLLMENGMTPTILQDPKAFKGLTEDELIKEIKQGQLLFKTVRAGADMRPADEMNNFN